MSGDYDKQTLERLKKFIHVDEETGCHIWTGARDKNGYGKTNYHSKDIRAHRLIYQLVRGNLSKDKFILHKCDRPSCCNIDHLVEGTPKDNMVDKVRKGRLRNQYMGTTHCKHGHEFTPENTRFATWAGKRKRVCVTCYTNQYKARNAAKTKRKIEKSVGCTSAKSSNESTR